MSVYETSGLGVTHVNINQRHRDLEVFGGSDRRSTSAPTARSSSPAASRSASRTVASDAQTLDAADAVAKAALGLEPRGARRSCASLRRTGPSADDRPVGRRHLAAPIEADARLAADRRRPAARLARRDRRHVRGRPPVERRRRRGDRRAAEQGRLDEPRQPRRPQGRPASHASAAAGAGVPARVPGQLADAGARRLDLPRLRVAEREPQRRRPHAGRQPGRLIGLAVRLARHQRRGGRRVTSRRRATTSTRTWTRTPTTRRTSAAARTAARGCDFDFPIDLTEHAQNYRDAAVANLFYVNNMIHDVLYRYGFDEASGNFQANNYGRGGDGGDYVRAEAPGRQRHQQRQLLHAADDGGAPRMQMYLWPGNQLGAAERASRSTAARRYGATWARFAPPATNAGPDRARSRSTAAPAARTPTTRPRVPDDELDRRRRRRHATRLLVPAAACRSPQSLGARRASSSRTTPTGATPPLLTGLDDRRRRSTIPAVAVNQADGTAIKALHRRRPPQTGNAAQAPGAPGHPRRRPRERDHHPRVRPWRLEPPDRRRRRRRLPDRQRAGGRGLERLPRA